MCKGLTAESAKSAENFQREDTNVSSFVFLRGQYLRYIPFVFIISFALTVMGFFADTVSASSATRLVEKSGHDSGDCTLSPCLTIQYAVDQAVAGDVVEVGVGMFVEDVVISAELTLQAHPTTVFNGHISATHTTLHLRNITIDGGTASLGGGLFVDSSTVTLTNVTIQNSQTTGNNGHGGGLFALNSTVTLLDSLVRDNQTATGSGVGLQPNGGNGGGIAVIGSTLHIERTSINRNTTGAGATASATFGTLTGFGGFGGDGGGIYASASDVTIINSTLSGNQTGDGGSASAARSGGNGAGVFLGGHSTLSVLNATIADNGTGSGNFDFASGQGGGLYLEANASITNTLALVNTEAAANIDCRTTISYTVNLVTSIGCDGSDTSDGLTTTIIALDEEHHQLQSSSPAIGAGDNCPVTDQLGISRPQDTFCDIGAVEHENPTAIILDSFAARVNVDGSVTIDWKTGQEINHVGFNIYRRAVDSRHVWTQANSQLITSEGTQAQGAAYQFVDVTVATGEWDYLLEDVGMTGETYRHTDATATVVVQPATVVTLTAHTVTMGAAWMMFMTYFVGLFLMTIGMLARNLYD